MWLLRRRRVPTWLRYVPPAAVIGAVSAALYTLVRIWEAFDAVSGAQASAKASLLAEGVSAALGGLVAGLAYVLALMLLLAYFTAMAPPRTPPELPAARARDAGD